MSFAMPGGVGSSLQKGLVGHWPLTGESEKVGSELITNGTFDSAGADWIIYGESTVNTGVGRIYSSTGDISAISQSNRKIIGKTYRLSFDIIGTTSGNINVGNTVGEATIPSGSTGHQTYTFVAGETALFFKRSGVCDASIDNVSLKEVIVADTTPYDNHGTIYGATSTTGPHGETDGAMSFDGTNSYVDFASNTIISGTSSTTLSAWINPSIINATNVGLVSARDSVNGMEFRIENDEIACWVGNGTTGVTASTTDFNLEVDTWHNILCSYDGANIKIYKNGVVSAITASTSGTIGTTTSGLTIGSDNDQAAGKFNGSISDVRIYNRALTADEVTQLYNEGGKTTVTQKPSLERGLVGHWALNGESEAWTALSGDAWQNSTAYGRIADTNYFSQNGNTIEITKTGSSWFGAGKMYATSEKGKYKIHIKTNLFNGHLIPSFHLYKDGTRVTYTSTQVPTTTTFSGNHASGFNYGDKSALGIYEATDVIDLTNAPDFDAIHVALLSYDGTASPYFEFQNTDIFVKQLVTADSTPYDNHGKIDGAVLTAGPNGETNGAMSFDGSNDYINCGTNSILDNEEALSVSAWIKTSYDAPFPGEIGIVKKGTGASSGWITPGWSFRLRDDIPAFALRKKDDTGYWDLYTGSPVIDGEWHHIVGTFDTTSIRKYVDGTQTQTASTGQPYLVSNGDCNIGKITNLFNGSISDVRIYNRALSEKEITQLYEDKAKLMGNKVPSLETGLVGHWPLSGGYTNTSVLNDITPYDNIGTITGTTLTTGINGEVGGATSFNGTSDYVNIPLNIYGYNEITYSTWIKINGSPASSQYSTITGNYGRSGIYISSDGKARARAWDTTDHYTISTTSVTDNQWHHIAATYDQNNTLTKIYVDGNHENQMSYYPNIINWPSSYIAENPRTTADIPLNGLMADTRLYNRALSADEIKRLYELR
jgi:hypothetical protein